MRVVVYDEVGGLALDYDTLRIPFRFVRGG